MSLFEVIAFCVITMVFIYFHCRCWKNCGFIKPKPYKPKSGSFIINKKEKNAK
jgi:hypothetical protein